MSLLRGQGGRVPIEDGSGRLALRGLGAIADHRQGEAAGSRRNRPKADLDREAVPSFLAPVSHAPGNS